jgi:methylisocitrate lyase
MGAVIRALLALQKDGNLAAVLDQMQHRRDLYDLIDYADYNQFDASVYNFSVPT